MLSFKLKRKTKKEFVMKKKLIVAVAWLLVLVFALSACGGSHGKTVITAGENELSINLFKLYLSRAKGALSADGYSVGLDSFWNEYVDTNNQTRAEFYTAQVLEGFKQRAAALILYDELGLKLPKEEKEAIEKYVQALIDQDANGSETAFESLLAPYGFNLTVFRDALIVEAKIVQLKAHLYGEGGARIGDESKEQFYDENYVRGMQILLAYSYHDYERDADGNPKYYTVDADGNLTGIAYDTEKGVAEQEGDKTVYRTFGEIAYDTENGEASDKRDTQGYVIYYQKGTEKIAYDTENGKPATVVEDGETVPELDENGEQVYRKWVVAYDVDGESVGLNYLLNAEKQMIEKNYTEEEMARRLWLAAKIVSECEKATSYTEKLALFTAFADRYSDNDVGNGMYFVKGATYTDADALQNIANKLVELDVGGVHVIGTENGYHIVMRCALDDGAWGNEANSLWFKSMNGLVIEHMLQKRLTKGGYLDRVEVDTALLSTVDIKELSPNYYY